MSLSWSFTAFPAGTFERIFGGTSPDLVPPFLELIRWAGTDGGLTLDIRGAQGMARHALLGGLSYAGRESEDAALLDTLIALAFSEEGQEVLGLTSHALGGCEGPDHYWAEVARKAAGSAPFDLLPWLKQGRRWKTSQACGNVWGAHLVLDPKEVALLVPELRSAIAHGAPEEGYREQVEDVTIPPLEVLRGQAVELIGLSG